MGSMWRWRGSGRWGVAALIMAVTLAPTTLVQASTPAPGGVRPEGPALAVEKAGDLAQVGTYGVDGAPSPTPRLISLA